jgi:hypothetical protein
LYRKLSTHDYKETGKTWPPSYFTKGPSTEEIGEWKRFIASYPWFPGTDDAYYRLAFSQYAQRDYTGCLLTIKEYLKRDYWPDNDASPYLMYLLRELVVVSDVTDKDMPFIPHIRNIALHPLAGMVVGSRESLDSVINSINWFLSNRQYLQFLDSDEQTLKMMRDVAETIKAAPSDSICQQIAVKLEKRESPSISSQSDQVRDEGLSPEVDFQGEDEETQSILKACRAKDTYAGGNGEYPSGTILSVLYSVFRNFRPPEPPSLGLAIPNDPGKATIRQVATFLNQQFAGASIESIKDGHLNQYIILALLHSGSELDKWQGDFKITMDFLSAIDNRYIPIIVAKNHLSVINRRKGG